jgi:hypothetical protein
MQAPEQTNFVCQKMVNEMGKLPYYISIDKPIPGKAGFENSEPFKKPHTEYDNGERNKPADDTIQYI